MPEPLLHIDSLTAWYQERNPVLTNVTLSIDEHSVVGLLGTNGAGKTTLINTLVGIHERFRLGDMTWRSHPSTPNDHGFRRGCYAVFTDDSGFAYWPFDAYMRFVCRVYGRSPDRHLIESLVDGFSFGKFRKQAIGGLSTGNRKKVFLIAGLSLSLPLLILDEPVDGLDFEGTEYLYEALIEYRTRGSVLMSSHVAESFTRCCDSLHILREGKLSENITLGAHTDLKALVKGISR